MYNTVRLFWNVYVNINLRMTQLPPDYEVLTTSYDIALAIEWSKIRTKWMYTYVTNNLTCVCA